MARVRRALQPITGNRRKIRELRPVERGRIEGKRQLGLTVAQIARDENRPDQTVRDTLQQGSIRIDQESLPRSGRPKKYTDRDVQHLYHYIRRFPYATYSETRSGTRLDLCNKTILSILRERNIGHWRQCERPAITQAQAHARMRWAEEHLDWTVA